MADVSVIIVSRNTCALTCAAVESVLASTGRVPTETIVVDNASTDETVHVLPRRFPSAKFVRAESNLGFARAANLGAREAAGEFLLLLNSDARVKADSLSKALSWMRQHPDTAVLGAQLLNPDGSKQNSIANFPSLATELLNKSVLRRLSPSRFPGKESAPQGPIEVESVVGAFMLVRRKLWQELRGLDERFFFFLEETDFCFRARRFGKVIHLPQLEVWHDQGQTAGHMRAAARIEYWRSRYLYFEKHYGRGTLWLLRSGLLARLFVDWVFSGLVVLLSLGLSTRWRGKWTVNTAMLSWHLRGCPPEAGLPRN